MAIFLSKTATDPFEEITIDNPSNATSVINERLSYTTLDNIDTVYLVLFEENKSEIRLIIENEPISGSSLYISKIDENDDPIKWEKQLKFTENLDTSQNEDNLIIIPIKIKWATVNNIYFNTTFNYNATINIYDIT